MMKARVYTQSDELLPYLDPWRELAANLAEANVFYEDWMLLPALAYLAADAEVSIVLIEDEKGLAGVFPLELKTTYKKLPIRHYRLWQHKHCFLCTPLIRKDVVAQTIAAFYDWLGSHSGPRLMVWNWIGGDGPILPAIRSWAGDHACARGEEGFQRSVLVVGGEAEPYISSVLSGGHLRDLRRLERRLGDSGEFTYEELRPGDSSVTEQRIQTWCESFLEIEASGWKGRSNTAMKCSPNDQNFFLDCVNGAHKNGKLQTVEAKVDGKTIASRCNFMSGKTAFSFKIAFDEKFSKSRPGLLLEVEHIRRVFSSDLERVDYCADPGHPMIDRLSTVRKTHPDVCIRASSFSRGPGAQAHPDGREVKEEVGRTKGRET